MKRPVLLIFASLVLLMTSLAAEPLRVMTFNIRYGTAKDGEDAWAKRKDKVIDVIRKSAPDLIGTQECLDFQAEYIVEQLPEYGWKGRGRNADGSDEMCAVFYKKDRLEVESVDYFWLSETPETPGSKSWDAALTRIVTQTSLVDKATGESFIYYNTHFDHQGTTARRESAKLIALKVEGEEESRPIILTGDFNTIGTRSEASRILTSGSLKDAWEIAETKSGPPNTLNGFKTPAPNANRRIDWILVSDGIAVSKCSTLDQKINKRYPSDHFPVVAEITFPSS